MSLPFTGSLAGKRKADLVEIADALHVPDAAQLNMIKLKESIQSALDAGADTLKTDPQFEGLYRRRPRRLAADSESDTDSPQPEKTPSARPRRSLGSKVIDRVVEAAEAAAIALPESPVPAKVLVDTARETADSALALVETDTNTLVLKAREVKDQVAKYINPAVVETENHWRNARDILSQPGNLLIAAIALEGAVLYYNVAPFHHLHVTFPPRYTRPGSFASFLENAFHWAPTLSWTVAIPRWKHLLPHSSVYPAFTWWLGPTVLPPLLLSTLVSFVPQKGVSRRGPTTRNQDRNPPKPTVDALTFAIFRFGILLLALSNAAPASLAETLGLSGDAQLRALGAGVLLALVLAQRLA